jgi:anaerobic glycerol-3-phosphate dehydrogenase
VLQRDGQRKGPIVFTDENNSNKTTIMEGAVTCAYGEAKKKIRASKKAVEKASGNSMSAGLRKEPRKLTEHSLFPLLVSLLCKSSRSLCTKRTSSYATKCFLKQNKDSHQNKVES